MRWTAPFIEVNAIFRLSAYMFGDQVDEGYEKVVRATSDAERINIGTNYLTKEQIENIAHKDPVTTQGKPKPLEPVISTS